MIFRRIQQLRISLAAKCQLLFGAAVILIIAAALFVPWNRIEQLTEQLNERTAAAMSDYALADHASREAAIAAALPPGARAGGTSHSTRPSTSRPASRPADGTRSSSGSSETGALARFVPLGPRRDNTDLSRFESRAAARFVRERNDPFYAVYYDRGDGSVGYRYARPLRLSGSCMACHSASAASASSLPAASLPTSVPVATAPEPSPSLMPLLAERNAEAGGDDPSSPLVGVLSVDFSSRVDANQLMLNRFFILAAGTIAGVLAIVTFYFITTRLILQPVRVLQETAEKVSKGDLNIRSDISTGDEFQQLSETFNVMLTNLNASADQLRAMNKSLDTKLGQLAESNVALYESNRLKSEFLANVSHELRTPLNSILGFADLLKETVSAPPDSRTNRYIGNILISGHNLLDLINDLLDLAKIEAGRMEVRSEPLSLSDMFEGLASLLKPLLGQKRLTMRVDVDADVPILATDPGKLQQVLYNFLSNAIKFSPVGQSVEVKAFLQLSDESMNHSPQDDGDVPAATPRLPRPDRARPVQEVEPQVRISVTDHGPGIAPEQQSVIFEKFRQVDASVTRTHGGTGLGLAISKELTLLMGGTIGVKSKIGEGATFWILLPVKVAPGARDVRSKMILA